SGAGAQGGPPLQGPLNFGTVMLGATVPPRTLPITNTGGAELTISSVSLSGANPNQFHIEDPGRFTLAPGQTKTVVVSYQPVSAGMHTASVVITPMGFAPTQVKLYGTAVQAVIQVPDVLDFDVAFNGLKAIGQETEPLQVGIKVPSNGIAVLID